MPTNVDVPPLGESVTEAVLLRWIKNDGEYVKTDEPICELETDKANVDLPAKGSGTAAPCQKSAGETVHVGEVIGRIDEAAAPAAAATAAAALTCPPSRPPLRLLHPRPIRRLRRQSRHPHQAPSRRAGSRRGTCVLRSDGSSKKISSSRLDSPAPARTGRSSRKMCCGELESGAGGNGHERSDRGRRDARRRGSPHLRAATHSR